MSFVLRFQTHIFPVFLIIFLTALITINNSAHHARLLMYMCTRNIVSRSSTWESNIKTELAQDQVQWHQA